MCFTIARKPRPWKVRVVYKRLLQTPRGALIAPRRGKRYKAHRVYNLRKGANTTSPYGTNTASEGFYVYRTLRRAKKEARIRFDQVVVRCKVRPEDFLFHDSFNAIATYRRIGIVGVVK